MSGFDLNVWFSESRLTSEQAAEIQQHVGSDWVIFAHDPHLDSFLTELRRRYPDVTLRQSRQTAQWGSADPFLESVDDHKPQPNTAAEMKEQIKEASTFAPTVWNGWVSQQGLFASMSILWERTPEVVPYIQTLARAHQLTLLDENGELSQFIVTPSRAQPAMFQLSLTLHIAGKTPALNVSVTDGHSTLVRQVVSSRLDAHLLAQSLARPRHEIGYHLDDPHCLAQAFEWVPVASGLPSSSFQAYQLKRRVEPENRRKGAH